MEDTDSLISDLKKGWYRQRSAIRGLVFKEFKIKQGVGRLGLFWVLAEPVVGMMVISLLWLIIGREKIDGVHVMLFIGSGFAMFNMIRSGIGSIPNAILANAALLNYPQVKPIDTLIARFILEMWLQLIAICLMFFWIFWLLDVRPVFSDPLLALAAIGTAMVLSAGIALPLAVYGTFYVSITKAVSILSAPLMLMSAVIYSINDLPSKAKQVLSWNPIVHVIEAFRAGLLGTKVFQGHNLGYPFMVGICLLGFGSIAYSVNRYKLTQP